MTAFTNVILNDGLATPVARTFTAKAEIDSNWTWWYQLASGISLAYPSISTRTLFARNPNGATKHTFNFRIPVVDTTIPGSPRLSHFHAASVVITTSDRGTTAERADLLAYVKNFLASTRATEIVVDMDPPR